MANFRQESQDLQLVNDLINSSFVPKKNDKVFIKETNMMYDFDHLSILVANGTTIIEQSGYSGRWIAISADVKRSEDVLLTITKGYNTNHTTHFYGEDSNNLTGSDDKIPAFVQINERSHLFIQDLITQGLEPKIRLMREPMGHRNKGVPADSNYSWTIPTHRNEVTGQRQSSGSQHSGNGAALMNDIDTKFDLPTDLKNHIEVQIHPTDWFRISGNMFGSQVLPIEFEAWHNDNKVRLRGRKAGRYHGRKKAIRFKFCLEWTSPTDNRVRLRSLPTFETLTLYPISGWFGVGGQYPGTTNEVQKYYYRWKLDVK
jgi:hypothetical protein